MTHAQLDKDSAERRIYHAQLITVLAVLPSVMSLTTLASAAVFGRHTVLGRIPIDPIGIALGVLLMSLFLLAWWLIGRRQRAGAMLGLALFFWMLAGSVRGGRMSFLNLPLAALGVILLVRAWPALRPTPVSSAG